MQVSSVKILAVVASIFFFTSSISGSFLTIYFRDLGLDVYEIVEILFFTFLVIGLLPVVLLRILKNFERLISYGIFFTMLFYVVLIYERSPVVLGLAYGLSIATFWPSFNLLQFRLSESKSRARTVSFFSSIIPSLASIIGPVVGGLIIQRLNFTSLFAAAVVLYLVAFALSMKIQFEPETFAFSIPKGWAIIVFFISFVVLGFSETYWLAYPFFVLTVSGSILNMGLVLAFSALLISAVSFLVNWLSDVKKVRLKFAMTGTILNFIWYFAVSYTSKMYEIVGLSLLSGFAGAFSLSWFAHYGDSFGREHYASILVLMEVGLMIGRVLNLVPTAILVSQADYANYFRLLGAVLLLMLPLYVTWKKKNE